MALRIGLDVKLHYNKMTKAQLTNLATRFRQAIVTAKKERAFLRNDRMSEFPRGCCDDTADLFSHYLYHEYGTVSIRIDGSYHDGNPENSCGHSWQEVDGLIVDLTGSQGQFKYDPLFLNYDKDVYVGSTDDFHALFRVERGEPCRGIEDLSSDCWNRMYGLYETIMRYLEL